MRRAGPWLRALPFALLAVYRIGAFIPIPGIDPGAMAETIASALRTHLKQLRRVKLDALVERRYRKFRKMGIVTER